MAYTNAVFFLDPISGSDSARTALTSCTASNPSGSITRINKTAHGLVTGAVVDLTLFSAWLNAAFKITVVDADNFDLDATTWQATADNSGTVTPRGGSSKADAWKTFSSGATSSRIAAGDTIRVIASTDPTSLGQTATWTKASKTVTLTSAVTQDIDTGESAWTASANVTCTTSATRKEGSLSASIAIAAGFTTGLAAYKTVTGGGTVDYSSKKQVSFWFQANATFTAGQLRLNLCSDNAGATPVDTLDLPAYPVANQWMPIVIDKGSALGASIQSVALYVITDFGAVTCLIDNVIACKDSTSADALTLQSLIGKKWNLSWAASTAYATNDIVKPTPANRTGMAYKVTGGGGGNSGSSEPTWPAGLNDTVTDGALTWTCIGAEDTWWQIGSIRGTTILLDNDSLAGRGYHGTTESVTTYKREPLLLTPVASTASLLGQAQASGSVAAGQITYSGGWDRSSMTSQSGETWLSGQTPTGKFFDFNAKSFVTFSNLYAGRCNIAFQLSNTGIGNRIRNCQASGGQTGLAAGTTTQLSTQIAGGFVIADQSSAATSDGGVGITLQGACMAAYSAATGISLLSSSRDLVRLNYCESKNNTGAGVSVGSGDLRINTLVTSDNTSALGSPNHDHFIGAATIAEATVVSSFSAFCDAYLRINNLNAGGAKVYTDGGTIAQSTSQRHTASGYSWLFSPTSTNRSSDYPLRLSVARVACSANVQVTFGIYVRRDSTDIKGRLMVRGGQIAGIGADAYTDTQPSINTWTQYTLAVTPTADGVLEVSFECYDGVGTTNSLWIDDLSKS